MLLTSCLVGLWAAGCADDSNDNPDSGTILNPDLGVVTTPDAGFPRDTGTSTSGPGCGNGTLETSEQCEGFDLRGETCVSQGFASGQLRCTPNCTLDTSGCAMCGNDTIESGEVCDGTDLGGATCADLLGAGYSGEVTCADDCLGVIPDACELSLPMEELQGCDPAGATPCSGGLSCVGTSQGDFCLDECDPATVGDCAAADACIDVGPAGAPAYACIERPQDGDVCTSETGCGGTPTNTCEPTFSHDGVTVTSVCTQGCDLTAVSKGQGDCPAGYSCAANPGGFFELEPGVAGGPPTVSCTPTTVTRDCDTGSDYECLQTGMDAAGGPLYECARYLRHCVTPQEFFDFASTTVPDGARCDLKGPTFGGRYCGLLGGVPSDPARVRCFPVWDGIDSVGACVGFCDAALSADGMTELDCGTAGNCVLPAEPQFFFPQNPSYPCPGGVPTDCDMVNGFDRCIDFGNGPECARPSKICAP